MVELPGFMRAVVAGGPGGPEALRILERPVPRPGAGEVLVRVAAAGLNRPDVMQRMGIYPPPPGTTDILGLELAGEVVATGPGTDLFRPGDRVLALVAGGAHADYVAVPEGCALPVPETLTMAEAAAIPETFFTVWTNVFERGGLKAGEVLLVHGGSSGIGTTAIMLAKAFGARVIATAGDPAKCAACIRIGADVAVDYRQADFVAATREATAGRGADVILDMVGGDYVPRDYEAAAEDGRIVQIAFLKGPKAEVDLRPLMMKRLTHTGSTLRNRPVTEKARIARALESRVWPLLEEGRCKPVIDTIFALEDVAQAHARMESGAHIGKIVLTVGDVPG